MIPCDKEYAFGQSLDPPRRQSSGGHQAMQYEPLHPIRLKLKERKRSLMLRASASINIELGVLLGNLEPQTQAAQHPQLHRLGFRVSGFRV